MADTASPEIDLNKLVALYVRMRDKKKEMDDGHKSTVQPIVDAMEKIEGILHAKLVASNAESMNTESGTFFKKKKVSITIANGETFIPFIKENNLWDLADIRAAKVNIEKYMEELDPSGELDADGKPKKRGVPPGLNYRAEIEIQVRRS